ELALLAADAPRLKSRMPEIEGLTARKVAEMAETIALGKNGQFDQGIALVRTGRGKQSMDAVRKVVGEVRHQEISLLRNREAEDAHAYRSAVAGVAVSAIAGAVALVAAAAVLYRYLQPVLRF